MKSNTIKSQHRNHKVIKPYSFDNRCSIVIDVRFTTFCKLNSENVFKFRINIICPAPDSP